LIGKFLWWGFRRGETLRVEVPKPEGLGNRQVLLPALFSGWVSLLVTNFFGFSVVSAALLFWLYPAICFASVVDDLLK